MNPYEESARSAKATKLATHLYAHRILSDELHLITDTQWGDLAAVLNVRSLSPLTLAKVKELLQSMESVKKVTAEELFKRCARG